MPFVAQVASGKLQRVNVFGNDYPTADGTGVRDYIHVVDLAQGHISALDKLPTLSGCRVFNLGTGNGYSVLDMIQAMSKEAGFPIPYVIAPRREGDCAEVYADASLAKKVLGWEANYGLDAMVRDMWKWTSMNPNGYNASPNASDASSGDSDEGDMKVSTPEMPSR
jgi:UDP-glucose 4-epimerase